MKCVISVLGKDRSGIVAAVSVALAECGANIDDISQTILQEYFTMIMLVDTAAANVSFAELAQILEHAGEERSLSIRIQLEDIFNAMHRI